MTGRTRIAGVFRTPNRCVCVCVCALCLYVCVHNYSAHHQYHCTAFLPHSASHRLLLLLCQKDWNSLPTGWSCHTLPITLFSHWLCLSLALSEFPLVKPSPPYHCRSFSPHPFPPVSWLRSLIPMRLFAVSLSSCIVCFIFSEWPHHFASPLLLPP